jgi:NADH:ubiquinone oxidoreductase subunit D
MLRVRINRFAWHLNKKFRVCDFLKFRDLHRIRWAYSLFTRISPLKINSRGSHFQINFGPAHPAAHGVFRLQIILNTELIVATSHVQGLLWRATEQLVEYRHLALISGYWARLDYVSYVAQELAYSPDMGSSSRVSSNFLVANCVANHILNTACTVADAGALGAILWGFEVREILTELADSWVGVRLHLNFGHATSNKIYSLAATANDNSVILVLLRCVTQIKITASRFTGNFQLSATTGITSAVTGWLLHAIGLTDDADERCMPIIASSQQADSFSRYAGRLMQIAVAEIIIDRSSKI